MSLVHVYPVSEERLHNIQTADCLCEPRIIDEGWDESGLPARVFVHQRLKKMSRSRKVPVRVLWQRKSGDGVQNAALWRQLFLR